MSNTRSERVHETNSRSYLEASRGRLKYSRQLVLKICVEGIIISNDFHRLQDGEKALTRFGLCALRGWQRCQRQFALVIFILLLPAVVQGQYCEGWQNPLAPFQWRGECLEIGYVSREWARSRVVRFGSDSNALVHRASRSPWGKVRRRSKTMAALD